MTEDSLRPTVAEQDPLVPLAGRHAVILWAVIAVIVLSVKALIEVRFNVESALAIAQGTGPEKVLIGLLVAFLPYLVLAGAAVGLEVAWRYHWPPFTTALSIGLWVVVAVLTPIWSVVVLLVGALVALIAVRRGARMPGRRRRGADTDRTDVGLALLVLVVVPATVFSGMWLPPERLTHVDGSTTLGYVAGTESGWLTVLSEPDRRLLRIKADTVKERSICRLRTVPSASLAQLLVDRPTRPPWHRKSDWTRGGDTMNAAGITPAAFMSGLASGGRGPALDQSAPPSVASRGDGRSRTRRRSWALAATTMVETLMAIAPTAIGRSMPQGMSRPAATGMARTL